jgi:hypothetical protein
MLEGGRPQPFWPKQVVVPNVAWFEVQMAYMGLGALRGSRTDLATKECPLSMVAGALQTPSP